MSVVLGAASVMIGRYETVCDGADVDVDAERVIEAIRERVTSINNVVCDFDGQLKLLSRVCGKSIVTVTVALPNEVCVWFERLTKVVIGTADAVSFL